MDWDLDGPNNKENPRDGDTNSIELQRIDRARPDRPLPAPPQRQELTSSPPKEATSSREGAGEWRRNIPRRNLPRPGVRALPSELREKGLPAAPDGALRRSMDTIFLNFWFADLILRRSAFSSQRRFASNSN